MLSHQEVAQLRGLIAAQQEELRSIHLDCAELQRRSASTEAELQRKSTHEEHALYQHFDDAIKEKDAQVHALQHELSRLQEKQLSGPFGHFLFWFFSASVCMCLCLSVCILVY